MASELYGLPLKEWVTRTASKMRAQGTAERRQWNKQWLDTYFELGGRSEESGKKSCPKSGAYALWRTRLLGNDEQTHRVWRVTRVDRELAKNAAYAFIAAEILSSSEQEFSRRELWLRVQTEYLRRIGKEPAKSEQGAVKVAKILYEEGVLT